MRGRLPASAEAALSARPAATSCASPARPALAAGGRFAAARSALQGVEAEALCRVLMAASGLVALHLDPPDFAVLPRLTLPALLAYLGFAAWMLVRSLRAPAAPRHGAWLDLGWGIALTALSGGTSSVLFFVLLLPIMSRSFHHGFRAGWTMTLVTTGSFLLVGLPTSPGGVLFEFNRAMIRPLTLLILGYMIAREGGVQRRARRHLALLAALNTIANPRFGAERTLLNAAARIRESYGARECLVVLRREDKEACVVVRSTAERATVETWPAAAVAPLFALPDELSVLHEPSRRLCLGPAVAGLGERAQGVCDVLGMPALASVPMSSDGRAAGRIFVLDARLGQFDESELEFLAEAALHLLHIVDKVELLDRLASLAAERERRRLACDLHDLAIQPYLGLQMGIEAALRRPACPEPVAEDLRGLLRLSHQGVDELRRMLAGERAATGQDDVLAESVARLAQQYRDRFGIEVAYDCEPGLRMSDRLAADVLAMISEGVSNARRHSASRWVRVRLHGDGDALLLSVANASEPQAAPCFVAKSIQTRARALGGEACVARTDAGETVVSVRIPL